MPEAKLTASAPVLIVKNVLAAAAYFRDKLGFDEQTLHGEPPHFAIIERDGIRVMLAQVGDPSVQLVPHWKIVDKMWNIYFWVNNAEQLYDEFQKRGAIIDYTLYTTPWGTLEFGVQDLDDHDIGFGQLL